jgi:hypothetical protein
MTPDGFTRRHDETLATAMGDPVSPVQKRGRKIDSFDLMIIYAPASDPYPNVVG